MRIHKLLSTVSRQTLLTGSVLLLGTAGAFADSHMLPPWGENTSSPCATAKGAQVLTWDGNGALSCAGGVTASSGNLSAGNINGANGSFSSSIAVGTSTANSNTIAAANTLATALSDPTCTAGAVVTISQTGGLTCSAGGGGTTTTGTTTPPACVPTTGTQSLACPTGQTGTIIQTRNFTCPANGGAGSWGAWATTSNTCAAPAQPTHYPATVSHVGDAAATAAYGAYEALDCTSSYSGAQNLYLTYIGRCGEPSGLAFWQNAIIAAGGITAQIITDVQNSALATCGGQSLTVCLPLLLCHNGGTTYVPNTTYCQ